jgi:hypothetical protein
MANVLKIKEKDWMQFPFLNSVFEREISFSTAWAYLSSFSRGWSGSGSGSASGWKVGSGSASASNKNPNPDPHQTQIRIQIRFRIRIREISRIRVWAKLTLCSRLMERLDLNASLTWLQCMNNYISTRVQSTIRMEKKFVLSSRI